MARAYRSGRRARRIILVELRRRQGDEAPSQGDLAKLADLTDDSIRYHLQVLVDRGWITWTRGEARSAAITASGLEVLDTI